MKKQILIVEDEPGTQALLRRHIMKIDPDAHVDCAPTAEIAQCLLQEAGVTRSGYDLVLCDLQLPGASGLALWNRTRENCPDLEFLFVSGISIEDWMKKLGPYDVWPALMRKPVDEKALRRVWEERFVWIGGLSS